MSSKNKLIFQSFLYSSSQIVTKLASVVYSLFVANFLGPYVYGLKNTLNLFVEYGSHGHLGTISTLYKQGMYYQDTNAAKIRKTSDTVFSFNLLVSIAIFLSLTIFAAIATPLALDVRLSLAVIALTIPLILFSRFIDARLQTKRKFEVISKIYMVNAFVQLIAVITFVYLFGLLGFFIGFFITKAVTFTLFVKVSDYKPKFVLNKQLAKIIRGSFLLFLISISYFLFTGLSRIMVLALVNVEALGYFGIAIFLSSILYFLGSSISAVVIPDIFNKVEKLNPKAIELVRESVFILAYIFPLLVVGMIILSPMLTLFLPAYNEAVQLIQILLVGSFFLYIINPPTQFLIAKNKEKGLVILTTTMLALLTVANYVLAQTQGTVGIALATSLVFFLYGTILLLYAFKTTLKSTEVFSIMTRLYTPITLSLIFVFGLDTYFPGTALALLVLKATAFLIFYLPFIYYLNKKTKVISHVRDVFFQVLKVSKQ